MGGGMGVRVDIRKSLLGPPPTPLRGGKAKGKGGKIFEKIKNLL